MLQLLWRSAEILRAADVLRQCGFAKNGPEARCQQMAHAMQPLHRYKPYRIFPRSCSEFCFRTSICSMMFLFVAARTSILDNRCIPTWQWFTTIAPFWMSRCNYFLRIIAQFSRIFNLVQRRRIRLIGVLLSPIFIKNVAWSHLGPIKSHL